MILNSFNDTSPCGEDCKYEDTFLLIEQEIDKNNSVTQDGNTDWKIVQQNCEKFLINQSKDLKIASWFLYSCWKNNSYNGLKNALILYTGLLNKFSQEIYPKSKKAKINIYNWLEESLTSDILNKDENKKSIILEEELLQLFNNLNTQINTQLETENNNFRKILQFLDSLVEAKNIKNIQEENIKISEEKKQKNIIKNKPVITPIINEEITVITNEQEAKKVLRKFRKDAVLLTNYYRNSDISSLKALRITRLLSWLDTQGLPNSDNKKTLLHPPSELEIDELKNLYKNNEYEEAFSLVEEILEVSPFWIDGHYYSFNILEKTKNFDEAKELKYMLISFLKINEGILDLYFTDDTAFASNKTKKWIQDELLVSKQTETKLETYEQEDNSKNAVLKEVDILASEEKIKEAMSLLNQQFNTSSTTEEKFNWRLHHAELAIEFDKKDIALALLEDLEREIDKYHLNEWNPKLASKVYNLLLTSFSSIDIQSEKLELIYKNLCKTDINSAFEIKIN